MGQHTTSSALARLPAVAGAVPCHGPADPRAGRGAEAAGQG